LKKNGDDKNMKTMKTGIVLLALLLAGMAMVPMVSAENNLQQNVVKTVQHSIEINSSAPQLSQSEFRTYVQQMSQKYGSNNVKALTSMTGEPDTTTGISYVSAWTDHLTTPSGGNSDCALILYKFNQADSSGKDHYYFWQWTSAQPNTGVVLTDFWNKVQLTNSNSRLITYSPGSTITGNQQTVNVGVSTGYSGFTFNIGGSFVLHQDTVKPKAGDCQVGYGGKYAVEWSGIYGNPQEIHGAMHMDIPTGQSLTSTWTNSLTAV
jgi:hypothetical protein